MGLAVTLSAPAPLRAEHDASAFCCGVDSLDNWLRKRALKNQLSGASRSYVVTEDGTVCAYYALAAGAVAVHAAPGAFRRNMPDPIPVAVLGRLAVDRGFKGRGLGRGLVVDAAHRIVEAASVIGIRGLLVHALDATAREFYLHHGFDPSPLDDMTLLITLADLVATLTP